MYSLIHSRLIISLNYFLEIVLLALCFFFVSCKIPSSPYYTPLTTYMLLILLILAVIQFLFFIFFWWLFDRSPLFHKLRQIACINVLLLLLMSLLCIITIKYFNLSCYFFCVLMLSLIYVSFRSLHAHLSSSTTKLKKDEPNVT